MHKRIAFSLLAAAALSTLGFALVPGTAMAASPEGVITCTGEWLAAGGSNPYHTVPEVTYTPPAGVSVDASGTIDAAAYEAGAAANYAVCIVS
jgi:hypothetical protein